MTGLTFVSDGEGDLRTTFGPVDVLAYIYAVFNSTEYRRRYEAQLKLDFPRVPAPRTTDLFSELVTVGRDQLSLHLLESPRLVEVDSNFEGPEAPVVGRVGWSEGTVWLDAAKTNARQGYQATKPGSFGFHAVPEAVWRFHFGGYQVCHKWLKDRKGRALSDRDIAHYARILKAIAESIHGMKKIDGVVESHGGWPDAFGPE